MKFRTAARRSVIIVAVILLSLLCGYLYHVIGHRIDLRNHPRAYEEIVTRYAAEYGTRLLMMNRGEIILDVAGEEKQNTKTEDLLQVFNRISVECGN